MSQKVLKLPNEFYDEALTEVLENNLDKPLSEYDIVSSAGSMKGDNFLGIVHRIQVIDRLNGKVVMSLIVKLPPENAARRNLTDAHNCFVRESNFYSKLYPIYKNFQLEKGINVQHEGFHEVPMCFKALADEPYEALFFEDLKAVGFEMFDRQKEVTKDHVILVLKSLAKLHALYFAIKDQHPDIIEPFETVTDHFTKQCEKENSPVKAWLESMKEQVLQMLEKREANEVTEKIKIFLADDFFEIYKTCIGTKDSHKVLCHGDVSKLW